MLVVVFADVVSWHVHVWRARAQLSSVCVCVSAARARKVGVTSRCRLFVWCLCIRQGVVGGQWVARFGFLQRIKSNDNAEELEIRRTEAALRSITRAV